jgi:subfamily B ATP-binding cassette protein MsbA
LLQGEPKPAGPPKGLPLDSRGRHLLRRFLADWVWPRWRQLVLALALTWVLAGATGAYPVIIKLSFDSLLRAEPGTLWLVIGAIVAVTLTRSIFLYLQTVATNRFVLRITTDIQRRVFAHLIAADYATLTREAPGQFLSTLTNDVTFISQGTQAALNSAIRDTLTVLTLFCTMLYLDWMMTLIVLAVYPIAALPITRVGKQLRRFAKRTRVGLGDMTSLLVEQLGAARLIKTFRLENYAVRAVHDSFERIFALRMKAIRARARLDPLLEALGGAAVAGVVGLAYWRISSGTSTVGDFMGFISALLMASQPVRGLGNLSGRVQEGLGAAERIYELLDEQPAIVDRPGARPIRVTSGTIRFDGVSFAYPRSAEVQAVRDFSLIVPGGRTVALVGPSGAGKSTIINLVPRLFDVDEGSITVDGQDVRDVTVASLRDAIAIVSQDVTLFDDTIRTNIALGRLDASEREIMAAAKAAAAHDFIMAQPQGYDTRVGDGGLRLSGGQRQRLALARAILKNAPILLLDEATSALDAESERLVQEALAQFTRGRTTLVIAHRLSTVQRADLIAVIDNGALVETGTHGELLARGGAYARLAKTQLLFVGPGEPASTVAGNGESRITPGAG